MGSGSLPKGTRVTAGRKGRKALSQPDRRSDPLACGLQLNSTA